MYIPKGCPLSSMISASTRRHRCFKFSSLGWNLIILHRFLADFSPSPMPDQEWTVVPPMGTAAIPVDAVTATLSRRLSVPRSSAMIVCKRYDLPVPTQRGDVVNREDEGKARAYRQNQ